ncbi:MAG: hypothetical protein DRN90_04760 [Thermoproteota archaeon]|nr:MAG: hypothetical protein DRN90_04760 [Candidatus Korarchaeota archaeon]
MGVGNVKVEIFDDRWSIGHLLLGALAIEFPFVFAFFVLYEVIEFCYKYKRKQETVECFVGDLLEFMLGLGYGYVITQIPVENPVIREMLKLFVIGGISYNADENRLYVVDGEYTYEDLYNWVVGQGLDIIQRLKEQSYYQKCKIRVGDGSKYTKLTCKRLSIEFEPAVVHEWWEAWFECHDNAEIIFGENLSDYYKQSRDGVMFHTPGLTDKDQRITACMGNKTGNIEMYSSSIHGSLSDWRTYTLKANALRKAYNILVDRAQIGGHPDGGRFFNIVLVESILSGSIAESGNIVTTGGFPDTPTLELWPNVTIRDVIGRDNSVLRVVGGDVGEDIWLINCVLDYWMFQWWYEPKEYVYRAYEFKPFILEESGIPFTGVVKFWKTGLNPDVDPPTKEIEWLSGNPVGDTAIIRGRYKAEWGDEMEDWAPYTVRFMYGNEILAEWKDYYPEKPFDDIIVLKPSRWSIVDIYDRLVKACKIQTNRWKIENNQLIIYDDDGVTPLIKFDLKDKLGNPAEVNVFERVPVE